MSEPRNCTPPLPLLERLSKEADRKGCMVALHPSVSAATKLAVGTEPASQLHVTLTYHGSASATDPDALNRVVAGWAASTPPVRAQVAGTGKFTNGEEPVGHLSVDAPHLSEHRARLVDAVRRAGLPLKDDHGFQPHMTLAYGEPDAADAVDAADGLNPRMTFSRVVVSHGGERTAHALTGS